MTGRHLIVFIAATTAVVALPRNITTIRRACGTNPPRHKIAAAEARFSANRISSKEGARILTAPIPVYLHVIQSGPELIQGNIPDSQITSSIDVMNQDYGVHGLTFILAGSERTTNADWFTSVSSDENSVQIAMKTALRQGGRDALNVYTVGRILSVGFKSVQMK
ncbi:hypothetical protein FRC09_003690 [Ceratobasidium sp. 395]|nr:hypothetical protein FRC09_003690 [Ceratobasidium sp. 395]